MTRRKTFVAITDSDDDSDDIPFSYCPHCKEYGFNNLLKQRIYPNNEPKAADHDNWMMCWVCGTLIPKVHSRNESKTIPFVEPEDTIHDSSKVAIVITHKKDSSHTKSKEIIDFIKRTRPGANRSKEYADIDLDLRAQIQKGKQLVNYSSTNDEFEG